MPLVFKIFLLLFLQQSRPVFTGQGLPNADSTAYAQLLTVPLPTHLRMEVDEHFVEQAVAISSSERPATEVSREPSRDFPGTQQIVLKFTDLSHTIRERIEQRLKNQPQVTQFQWLIL